MPQNQTVRHKTGGRGQAPPLRGNGPHISRNGRYRWVNTSLRGGPQARRGNPSPRPGKRIPTAPPGPRNDGEGTHCAPAGGHMGPPLQKHRKCNVEPAAGASPRPTWLHHTGAARPVVAPYIHCIGGQNGRPHGAAPTKNPVRNPSLRGGPQARRGNPFSRQKGNGFPRPLQGLGMTGWVHRVRLRRGQTPALQGTFFVARDDSARA